MPNTAKVQWPQGQPQFETHWRAVTEALAGNGVVGQNDLEVTSTATSLEIQVATGTVFYVGSTYSLGTAETHTLSSGGTSDRWDTVYFDTATTSSGVREGTAGNNPEPPDIQGDEILLATIYVPASATDVPDSDVLNWRTASDDAGNSYLKDTGGEFTSDTVENALTELIRESGDPLNGPLDLSSFSGGSPFELGTNPGAFGAIVDGVIDSNSGASTVHSYTFDLDGTTLIELRAESDGAGGVQNAEVRFPVPTDIGLSELADYDLASSDVVDGGVTVYDSTNEEIKVDVNASNVIASSRLNFPTPSSDPSSPSQGDSWIRSDNGILKWYDGTVTRATGRDH